MPRNGHLKLAGWHPVGFCPLMKRANAWQHVARPATTVRHCGHPTANYPYYIERDPLRRTFRTLNEAQLAVEREVAPTAAVAPPDFTLTP